MKRTRFNEDFEYPTVWGFTQEMNMFTNIWGARPHVSFLSGQPIVNPGPENFAHVLPKALNQFPLFRLNPENVVLLTYEEHFLIDSGSEYQRQQYQARYPSADFTAMTMLKTKLQKEYLEFEKQWKK